MALLKAGQGQTKPETPSAKLDAIIDRYKAASESSSSGVSESGPMSLDLRGFISSYTQSRSRRGSDCGMVKIAFAAAGKPSGIARIPPR